jgi:allophanate hydrolase
VEVDYTPFRETAQLLYDGPFVAERLVAAGSLLEASPESIHSVVRSILEGARRKTALEAFQGLRRLTELRRATETAWSTMDFLLLPTTPTIYPIAEVELDPIGRNSRLGYYTHFANLLDLAAVAVPAGFRRDGLPSGVSVIGRAGSDRALSAWAARFHALSAPRLGATKELVVQAPVALQRAAELSIAVAGAHLSGQPLNHQLTSRGGRLLRTCRSSSRYRLYALRTEPPKPGLVFDARFEGPGIELEVWALDPAAFGSFVDEVPAPLAIGTVTLDDGTRVNGFVCEPAALEGAEEISAHAGWRAYRAALAASRT